MPGPTTRSPSGDEAGCGAESAAAEGASRSTSQSGEKRVRNERIKSELGVALRYPTYREGLAAIHAGDRTPFGTSGQH